MRAMRATARAKSLRAKFEEWEQTHDAREQSRQMELHDENGASLETASHLKARFEALKMAQDMEKEQQGGAAGGGGAEKAGARPKFRPRRFKVSLDNI